MCRAEVEEKKEKDPTSDGGKEEDEKRREISERKAAKKIEKGVRRFLLRHNMMGGIKNKRRVLSSTKKW